MEVELTGRFHISAVPSPPFSSLIPSSATRTRRGAAAPRRAGILEPGELLRRLAALVPPPRSHLVRYHGVEGPELQQTLR